jgi:NADH-quinone oxidoreductase subunit L
VDVSLLQHAYWIVLAPLCAFAIIIFFRKWIGMDGAWVGVVSSAYGFLHSLLIWITVFKHGEELPGVGLQGRFFESAMTWFTVGQFNFQLGLLIDGLSSTMLVVVTLVALLVQIYSLSYMHGHVRYGRYFAYVNMFTFAMLVLVVANNLLQFYMGWELVGLCSYLLISFDFERDAAAYAGRKAFLTTKAGDLGLHLGLLMIFNYLGTFNIPQLHENVSSFASSYPTWVITAIPILLFFGAMGKSAQFPLHVWLPDAMEGPTPASALIHAATMVAAGVYLVARVFFMFQVAPISMEVVAWIGVTTAVFAATMGLVSSDIKRVLAFSTVSQLGFMMAALGCSGYEAGMFHLTTHAAFKALLFLCAGSVIHAVHTNDMWSMGGLRTKMPITALAYFFATLAISGCWPFSGFYSKDEILAAAYNHNIVIFALLALAALMTSFYMFRSLFLTFAGTPRDKDKFHHAHESPFTMTVPLMILAVLSIGLGFSLWYHGNLSHWISWGAHEAQAASHGEGHDMGHKIVLLTSLMVFAFGLLGAAFVYLTKPSKDDFLAQKLAPLHKLLSNRYYVDEFYLALITHVYHPLSRFLARIDYDILDQKIVDGVGLSGRGFSWLGSLLDDKFVDKVLVDGNGSVVNWLGKGVRRLQSGLAQSYLFWMAIGLVSMFIWVSSHYK